MNTKFTSPLLVAGLIIASGTAYGAESKSGDAHKTLPPASTKQGVTFATDIKPLFDASCVRCHGEQRPKAGLRLDTREGVLKGSKEDKVLIVGDSAKSPIVIAVARIDRDTAMPPEPKKPRPGGSGGGGGEKAGEAKPGEAAPHPEGGAGSPGGPGGQGGRPQPAKPLTADEVGLVRAWIDQGAK